MEIVYLIVGIIVGLALAFFFFKARVESAKSASQGELSAANEKAKLLESNILDLKNELRLQAENSEVKLKQEHAAMLKLAADLATANSDNNNLHQKLLEQRAQLDELNNKFAKEFENLANRIFEEKSQKFSDQNRNNLDVILTPFKEKLKEFEQKVDIVYKNESAERITLKAEIKNLVELNKQISEEANNLATALKGDNKQQGNWGELILEKILENSGLKKDEDYKTQVNDVNGDGGRIKPDVVVYLPDNKHIIIDSKVSLVAYEACVNATVEEDRQRYLKAHLESLRGHIKLLSDKSYYTAAGLQSPEFVLLFVPIESSFSLAIQGDADLFNFAWDRKIVVVSPSTLFATLRTIASVWKHEKQTRNALEIAEEGGKLYDKFVSFYEDLVKVGKKMDDAKGDYAEAMKKLYDGTGNLIKRAQKMKELGAKTTKQLPQAIIERAGD